MRTAIVSGSGGLVGSESVRHFAERGYDVIGLENDMRAHFFGPSASTAHTTQSLEHDLPHAFRSLEIDVRDVDAVMRVFAQTAGSIELVIHAAGQPSHDWAASDPQADFTINANGTLNLLEATRRHAPAATFIFCSTNKVYGDLPNHLPLVELETRLELPPTHRYHQGIDTSMSIDASTHSLFGVSKASGDLLVQEYGRYFGMPTVCFRGGCLTGPNHAGARLHGFLSYLMRCAITGDPYTVYGYGGKQVRDNIHSADLVAAFEAFHATPGPRPSTTSAAGGRATARCSRPSSFASRSRTASSSGFCRPRAASATTAGGSPTSRRSSAIIPRGGSPATSRPCCGRSSSATPSCGALALTAEALAQTLRVTLLHLAADAHELDEQLQLFVAVALAELGPLLGQRAHQVQGAGDRLRCELDQHAAPVGWVGDSVGQPGALQPVDHGGDGAAGQPALCGQLARTHPAVLVQQVERARIRAVDPQELADELVNHVRGPLAGADLRAQLVEDFVTGWNFS